MKKIMMGLIIATALVGCGKEIELNKLQERNGIYYEVNQTKGFTGKVIDKYPNGQLKGEGNFKNGKREGSFKTYHANGQVKIETNYKNGELDGISKAYWENGKLLAETTWKDGKEVGIKLFDVKGNRVM